MGTRTFLSATPAGHCIADQFLAAPRNPSRPETLVITREGSAVAMTQSLPNGISLEYTGTVAGSTLEVQEVASEPFVFRCLADGAQHIGFPGQSSFTATVSGDGLTGTYVSRWNLQLQGMPDVVVEWREAGNYRRQ